MAQFPKGQLCSVQYLSKKLNLPSASLSKSFQPLVKQGVLTSTPGRFGGFSLSRQPEDITLHELKLLLEPSQKETDTHRFDYNADAEFTMWNQLQSDIEGFLKKTTIADLHQSLIK